MFKQALIIGGTKGLGITLAGEGTCNRGIGRAVIVGRSKSHQLHYPYNSELLTLDLTDPESVEQLARRRPEPFDYIFWVAGNFHRGALDQMPSDKIDKMIATHLSGPVRALQLLHLGLHYIH